MLAITATPMKIRATVAYDHGSLAEAPYSNARSGTNRRDCDADTYHRSHSGQCRCSAEYRQKDVAGRGTQRGANTELLCALAHDVAHDSVDPDDAENSQRRAQTRRRVPP